MLVARCGTVYCHTVHDYHFDGRFCPNLAMHEACFLFERRGISIIKTAGISCQYVHSHDDDPYLTE